MFVRFMDRQVFCQFLVWDFGDGEDYRCSVLNDGYYIGLIKELMVKLEIIFDS